MNSEQAKLILSASRLGETGDPLLEEALALMESDPALAEWFAEQTATDAAMRDSLRSIEPPAHLREAILAAAKVTPFPAAAKSRRLQSIWLAIAAGVVLVGVLSYLVPPHGNHLSVAQLNAEIPRLTAAHAHSFDSKTGDLNEIRAWLAANGGAIDFTVPEGLKNHGGIGCEIASVQGTKVSILCFPLGEGRIAHLYIVDKAQLAKAPALDAPSFDQLGEYAVASWSHGGQSYFLAEHGNTEAVQRLL